MLTTKLIGRPHSPSLHVCLSVDWEGTDLKETNLQRILDFKKKYQLPLIHYLNAAYFIGAHHNQARNRAFLIHSLMDESDEWGLHLHAQRALVEAAGVHFQSGPCFSRGWSHNWGELEGQEVMLHAYPREDIKKLMEFSVKVLASHGFSGLTSFRAGGWMAEENILEVVRELGFLYESSATPARLLQGTSWQGENLQRYIEILWPNIEPESNPYEINTPHGSLWELPNNMGAIDYWDNKLVEAKAEEVLMRSYEHGTHVAVVNSHQETASDHWHKMEGFIDHLLAKATQFGVDLRFSNHAQCLESRPPMAVTSEEYFQSKENR